MAIPKDTHLVEFIHRSNEIKIPDELINIFLRFLEEYDVDHFSIEKIFHDSNLVDQDPAYQAAIASKGPFIWRKITSKERLPKKPSNVILIKELQGNVSHNGIALSIYRPFGEIVSIELFSSKKDLEYNKNTVHVLYAAFNQFLIIYARLTDTDSAAHENDVALFTLREREVLLWLARGKSKNEISLILEIGESAVKRHSESIFRKLEVNNLQFALAKALKMGLIQPY